MDSSISGSDEEYGVRSINSDWDPEDRGNSIISLSSATSSSSSQQSFLPTFHGRDTTITPSSHAIHNATPSIEPFIEHPADHEAPPAEPHHEVEPKSDEEAKGEGAVPTALSLDSHLADLSRPESPASFTSTSGNQSSVEASPTLGSTGWGRSEGGTSVVSDGEGELSELVMPSMRFAPPSSSSERSSKATPSSSNSTRALKLLIYGKTQVERRRLGQLLGDRRSNMQDTDTDLSCSFLSNQMSDRSRNSSAGHFTTHQLDEFSGDFDDLIELPDRTSGVTFMHPSDDLATQELVDQLLAPLARLDSLLNPSYPSTQRLADFIAKGSEGLGAIEGCLMLFSSPPLPSEIANARKISQLLPIFPILLLPPSSKPQKTSALIHAVCQQFDSAGVSYTPAFESLGDTKRSPLYVLPSELFEGSDPSSGTSSLASSQELPHPPTISPHSHEGFSRDLSRLRTLVSSPSCQERIKRTKVLSFLFNWREVEVAARGIAPISVQSLPSAWNDRQLETTQKQGQQELDFSKRVAQRRSTLTRDNMHSLGKGGLNIESPQGENLLRQKGEPFDYFSLSSQLLDPMTPRCSSHNSSQPTSSHSDAVSTYEANSLFLHPLPPPAVGSRDNYSVLVVQHDPSTVDPFHLPSFIHLVGLNLRLAFLPNSLRPNHSSNVKTGAQPLLTLAVVTGAFVIGLFCGRGNLLLWKAL